MLGALTQVAGLITFWRRVLDRKRFEMMRGLCALSKMRSICHVVDDSCGVLYLY